MDERVGQAAVEESVTRRARTRRLPVVPQIWLVAGGGWIGRIVQVVAPLLVVRILTDQLCV